MEVRILDSNGRQLSREQLKGMNIWNETMEHICATAMERVRKEEITSSVSVANR